jgi:hypothetical protein
MGGLGSGRRNQGGKDTTKDYLALDARWLQRNGLLAVGKSTSLNWSIAGSSIGSFQVRAESDSVVLRLDSQTDSQRIQLDRSSCHLGGKRVWFLCPSQGCGRRVALLYMGSSGHFACRQCQALAYASQRETGYVRALGKMERLRDKLDWGPGIISCDRSRPKGMHRRTYVRLVAEHDGLVGQYLAGMTQRVEDKGRFLE